MLEGHNTSRARVINNLRRVDGIDVSDKLAVLYRSIRTAKSSMESDPVAEFKALPAYLEVLLRKIQDPVYVANWMSVVVFFVHFSRLDL